MITEDHKELIRKAVLTKDKAVIDAAFQRVIQEEIGRISNISNVAQNYICELASFLKVPYKHEVTLKNEAKNEESRKIDFKCVGMILIVFIAIAIISSEFGIVLGICLSLVCAGGLYYHLQLSKTKNSSAPIKPEYFVVETADADDLVKLVDGFINKIKLLVDEVAIHDGSTTKPDQLLLHECYPNVLKWFQNLYSDSLDFDEKMKEYMIKRIDKIMDSCYYDIILFEESNKNKFEINYNRNIDSPIMAAPAFIYSRTGKVILPGIVAIPNKKS